MGLTVQIADSPLQSAGDAVNQKFKENMVDGNVYDTRPAVYPASTSGYTMQVSGATADQTVEVFHNGEVTQSLIGKETYTFTLFPANGSNSIYAVQGSDQSNQILFTADNLQALVWSYSQVFRDRENELRQAWADGYLSSATPVSDTSGNTLSPTVQSLVNTWGDWLDLLRISGQTTVQYINALQTILEIYQQGAVVRSLTDVGEMLGDTSGTGSTAIRVIDMADTMGIPVPYVYVDSGTTIKIYPGKVLLDNKMFNVAYITGVTVSEADPDQTLGSGETFVILNPSGGTEAIVPVTSTGEPGVAVIEYLQQFTSSQIQTDIDGDITGMIDGKFVILDRIPMSITASTGSSLELSGSSRILVDYRDKDTPVVDLGTRLDVDDIVTGDNVQLTYTALQGDVLRLARIISEIEPTSTTVTAITDIRMFQRPSSGALGLPSGRSKRAYGLFLTRPQDQGLHTLDEKNFAQTILQRISPFGAQGRLFFNRSPWADPYYIDVAGYPFSFWFRVKSLTGLSHDDRIENWESVVNSVTATQAASIRRPAYITGATPHGGAVVRFGELDGSSSDYMNLPDDLLQNKTGYTVFAVARGIFVGASEQYLFSASVNGGNPLRAGFFRNLNGTGRGIGLEGRRADSDDAQIANNAKTVSGLDWSVDCAVFNYAEAQGQLYQDGVLLDSFPFSTSGATDNTVSNGIFLCGGRNSGNRFLGDVTDILAFDAVLPQWAVVAVSNFLHRINLMPNLDLRGVRGFEYYGDI